MKFNWKKLLSFLIPILVEVTLPLLNKSLSSGQTEDTDVPESPLSRSLREACEGPQKRPWWEGPQ